MERPLIVGLGEILWDMFPTGPRFGGAPANFACAVSRQLGSAAHVEMVSAVGPDRLGTQALDELRNRGVGIQNVHVGKLPTGQVLVDLDAQGQATYRFAEQQAWDEIGWNTALDRLAQKCAVVCFGTLAQRRPGSRATIEKFVATAQQAYRLFDINIRQPHFSSDVALTGLRLANVVKLNEDELPIVGGLIGVSGDWQEVARNVRRQFDLQYLAVTRGADGAFLLSPDQENFAAAPVVDAVSTVGAGDAYAAALVAGMLEGKSVPEINQRAVALAAKVCSG
ncbi:MAG: PfkB family carbohydrate kinase [Pirellulaceae bacterium]|nr:PfkB family carbohydrate kinase [Pirellulaceae bacterium]